MDYWPLLNSQLSKERLGEMKEEHPSIHSYNRNGDDETIFFMDATILRVKKGKEKIIPFSKSSFIRHFGAYVATAFKISKNSYSFLKRGEWKPTSYESLRKIVEEHGGATCIQSALPQIAQTAQIAGCSRFHIRCSDGKKIVYDDTLESAMFF